MSRGPSQGLSVSWKGTYCRPSVIALTSFSRSYTEMYVLLQFIIKTELKTGEINESHAWP